MKLLVTRGVYQAIADTLPQQAVCATLLLWSHISCWRCGHPCLHKYSQECSLKETMADVYIPHNTPHPSTAHTLCKLATQFARINFQVLPYLIYFLEENIFLLRLVRRPVIPATEEAEAKQKGYKFKPSLGYKVNPRPALETQWEPASK